MQDFPRRLGELIVRRGMNQKELAAASGLTEAAVSRYLSGERRPGAEAALSIARALDVSVEYLLSGEESFARTPEVMEMLENLRMRPELRELMYSSHSASPDEVVEAIRTLERLKEQRGR